MVCYRRHGHNEGDDPSYTQPLMYKAIAERRSVRKLYVETLVKRGDITLDEAEGALNDFQSKLQLALDETRAHAPEVVRAAKPPKPRGVLPHVDTGVERAVLDKVFAQLTNYPEGFTVHPKLGRQFAARAKQYDETGMVDWATAEAFAIGSLVLEGTPVRLAGEDTRRGTFSHRHAALVDYENEQMFIPLAQMPDAKADFWVYDSLLSEYAALGYEYGYAHANPDALVVWEAQFGDFINGAQIIIDQYLVAAEDKWGQENGLVLLLPHGYEGQGPEHSSARIERFLTLCAEDNIQVVNATTSAQYFHLLRRQVRRDDAQAAGRLRAEVAAADEGGDEPRRPADEWLVPRGARRSQRDRSLGHRADRLLLGQGLLGCVHREGQARRTGRGHSHRAAVSVPCRAVAADPRAVPATPAIWCGCRKSPRTWARGASSRLGCGGSKSAATTCAMWPESRAAARRPARRRSTTKSSPT